MGSYAYLVVFPQRIVIQVYKYPPEKNNNIIIYY